MGTFYSKLFLKISTNFIVRTTLLIIPNGVCKIECLKEKIYLIGVQIY